MEVVVLGAGIVGVTTAWQLLKEGHDVTVVDREPLAANFTSFGNAGLIAPGHAYSWSSPAAPGMMLRSMWRGDQAIRFRPRLSLRQWKWVASFLAQCTNEAAARNTRVKSGLCEFSRDVLRDVVKETGIKYHRNEGGIVYFYRTQKAFDAAREKSKILTNLGVPQEILSREQTIERDPGLEFAADQIAGAVFAPDDESGDCHVFANRLAEKCIENGAVFRFGETVLDLEVSNGQVASVITDKGRLDGDSFVLCMGVYSAHIAEKLGVRLPIYPVKGYSMTVPMPEPEAGPTLGGVDEENLLAYCPMGNRLRLTATAEISGYSNAHVPSDFKEMTRKARALFGDIADFDNASHWAGLRPMTPTGVPVIDRSPIDNFWINSGHGHMGWTMSNGSARILADLMGQRAPSHSNEGFRYEQA